MRIYYVYILASRKNGKLYIGMTNNLIRRVYEHKIGFNESYSKRYHIHDLVYYEIFPSPLSAIHREKCIKKWYRQWKIELIEKDNPDWKDLYHGILRSARM